MADDKKSDGGSVTSPEDALLIVLFAFVLGVWIMNGGLTNNDRTETNQFVGPSDLISGRGGTGEVRSQKRWYEYLNIKGAADSRIPTGDRSEYFDLIKISRTQNAVRNNNVLKEYIVISYSPRGTEDVTITGWGIESTSNRLGARIPEGTEKPKTGVVNDTAPIVLSPGDSAIIMTSAPSFGTAFRESLCTGYLDQFQDVSPPLMNACPSATSSWASYASVHRVKDDDCTSAVTSLSSCETFESVPEDVGDTCVAFIQEELNYSGCVAKYEESANFYLATWRVYLGLEEELYHNVRDTVTLVDTEGFIVDQFAY